MKLFMIAFTTLASLNALATENYSNIVCEDSAGSQRGYHTTGHPWDLSIGCNPSATCAADKLRSVIATIPNANEAAYSKFLKAYVEVTRKTVSKVSLVTTISRMNGFQCAGNEVYRDVQVDCSQSTACTAINVTYSKCTQIAYDQHTGGKIVTCPSGKVIRE